MSSAVDLRSGCVVKGERGAGMCHNTEKQLLVHKRIRFVKLEKCWVENTLSINVRTLHT